MNINKTYPKKGVIFRPHDLRKISLGERKSVLAPLSLAPAVMYEI